MSLLGEQVDRRKIAPGTTGSMLPKIHSAHARQRGPQGPRSRWGLQVLRRAGSAMNRHFPPPIITPRVPRERLDEAIQRAQASYPHLVPIYEAVRDFGCVHAIIPQRSGPFDQPKE